MNAYQTMLDTNYRLIKGETLSQSEKEEAARMLLSAKSKDIAELKPHCRNLRPLFFIPPYNDGKKLTTVLGQTPKTEVFSANMYELEILRLLSLLKPDDSEVSEMITVTAGRLKTTCFGYDDDGMGECFDASLVVLRFLATAAPSEKEWINSRIENFNRHFADKKRPSFPQWYYWLCLSELPFETAKPETDKYKDEITARLSQRSYVMNSQRDRTLHPVILCILRNLISQYPQYAHIKRRAPYINPKDSRLYFDITP